MQNSLIDSAHNEIISRVNELVKKRGLNIPKLAKKTGIAIGTIQRILTNPQSNPTYSTLRAIAKALEVTIGELIGEIDPTAQKTKNVRIVSWDQIVDFQDVEKITTSNEYCTTTLDVSDDAFALRMKGNHMLPIFPENTLLIFDPKKNYYDRSYVLVKLKQFSTIVFKQLILDEPFFYIKSINPDLINESLKQLDRKDEIIATLVQSLLNY